EANAPWDRELSARLYGGDQEMRILQEIILGIGGVRVLRALGLQPTVWHANEGHATFLTLERLRECRQAGLPFGEAMEAVKASTVFTTHTPVPAGHDAFPFHLMEKYFTPFCELLQISREDFLRLGCAPGTVDTAFNMTVLGLQMSGYRNAQARLRWIQGEMDPAQVLASGTLLDPDALTIGFARRFATYKRATLLFRDLERLKRLMQDPWRPVQIIFAGKAHPADEHGK